MTFPKKVIISNIITLVNVIVVTVNQSQAIATFIYVQSCSASVHLRGGLPAAACGLRVNTQPPLINLRVHAFTTRRLEVIHT
jgi:hypothetical protein